MGEQNHYVYEFGPFQLDATRRVLLKQGEPLKLFPKEFDTLLALVERSGELLEKEELIRRVWQGAIVEESNLTTNISHLRKVLGESRDKHDYIVTVPGRGYRFVAGVTQGFNELIVRERTKVTVEQEENQNVDERYQIRAPESATQRARRFPQRELLLVASLALLTAVGWGVYKRVQPKPGNPSSIPFGGIELTRLTNSGRATVAALSPDRKYVVYVSKDTAGESLWLKQVSTQSNVQIAPPTTMSYWGLTFSPDGEYVYCVTAESNKGDTTLSLIPVLGGPARQLPVGPHGPVSFSPEGNRFAFINAHRDVFYLNVADVNGDNQRQIAKRSPPEKFIDIAVGPAWSPNGDEIACAVRKLDPNGFFESVTAIRVSDGAERPLTSRRWSGVGQVAWLPDSTGLIVTARESSAAPFQIWYLPESGGEAHRITNDLNDYSGVSYNEGTHSLLAVQKNVVSGVWIAPADDLTTRKVTTGQFPIHSGAPLQIASGTGRMHDVAWIDEEKIVYVSNASNGSNIWLWDPKASVPRQLTLDARNVHGLAVSPNGRYLVFSSDRGGTFNLYRTGLNGGELVRLTSGDGEVSPRFSPDGKWVVFQKGFPTGAKVWRIPIEGGEPIQLTQARGQKPDVSPDGKLIAYYTLDSDAPASPWIFGVMSFDGGPLLKRFTFGPTVGERLVRWVPGGWGLAYLDSPRGISNIWVQPLDGGPPQQLSDFKAERLDSFDWSPDGRRLVLVRNTETSDVVLIEAKTK